MAVDRQAVRPHGPGPRSAKCAPDVRAADGVARYRATPCGPERPTPRALLGLRLSSGPEAALQVGKVVETQAVTA